MNWALLSGISGVGIAGFFLVNEHFKVSGLKLLFWRGLFPALLLSPFSFLMSWPTAPMFYFGVGMAAIFASILDTIAYNGAARFGGGVISRLFPLSLLLTFVLWFFISPDLLKTYLQHPVRLAGITGAFIGCVYFISHFRHCPISRQAFFYLLPAIFCAGITPLFSKIAFNAAPTQSAVYAYIILQGLIIATISMTVQLVRTRGNIKIFVAEILDRRLVMAGFCVSCFLILHSVTKGNAYILSPHPAYAVAIASLSPLWISAYYYVIKHREKGDVRMGMMAVLCVILLTILVP